MSRVSVYATSFHRGSKLDRFQASTVADVIEQYDISMEGVSISVDGRSATPSTTLVAGQTVSLQKNNIKSGN